MIKLSELGIPGSVVKIIPTSTIPVFEYEMSMEFEHINFDNISEELSMTIGSSPIGISKSKSDKNTIAIQIPHKERD